MFLPCYLSFQIFAILDEEQLFPGKRSSRYSNSDGSPGASNRMLVNWILLLVK